MTTEFILRLFIAALLGGCIGIEREYRAKEAGLRTHLLVALGSALFMIISQFGFDAMLAASSRISLDPSRIASQVVTGIGFIGAGTIIFQKHVIKGLTTAAGLWVTSAIGLTCGAGMTLLAIASTLLVLICLEALNYAIERFGNKLGNVSVASADIDSISLLMEKLKENGIEVDNYEIHQRPTDGRQAYECSMEIKMKRMKYHEGLHAFIGHFDNVTILSIE